jgi:putative endonuclease
LEENTTGGKRNTKRVGDRYETLAAEYLSAQNYRVLERNFRCRSGEIDIIARDGEYLCFVEVKYRATGESGCAASAVDYRKQQKIIRVAQYYLVRHGYGEWTQCRFDVIAIDGKRITLYRDAFGA